MLREHERTQSKLKEDLGELVLSALSNDEIFEIMLNPDGKLWVEGFIGMKEYGQMAAASAQNLINTVSSVAERITDKKSPSFGGELWVEFDNEFKLYRFQAFMPPITKYPAFVIRKPAGQNIPIEKFVEDEVITKEQEDKIKEAVRNKKSILVAGGTQSGKTTLANAILDYLSRVCQGDRIIIIEDTQELRCTVKNCLTLQTSPEKSMNDLIYDAMRARPDRIIIGEVRGKEAHSLIKAWNTGHPGGLSTIHANSAASSLLRLEQLIMEAGVAPVPESIAEAVNVLIYIQKTYKGKKGRQVTSILELTGYSKEKGYCYV
jgi:type IV secretion system protein VirB11